ncbi:hypothetical protein ColLi_12705 [Colletotrichum liriopes]|uniref:Uncharacterized protein n=1 Tax=Colletotrichum liriopes TaxID=708192 RepID=A0AA37H0V3_9PEZI|nr:hypothetical protein ColLi_12705 [Colletotrichum liriopes]
MSSPPRLPHLPAGPATDHETQVPTSPSFTNISSLPQSMKDLLGSATHADDDALFALWVQLARTLAFLGPSAARFQTPGVGSILATAARACEAVVIVADLPADPMLTKLNKGGGSRSSRRRASRSSESRDPGQQA